MTESSQTIREVVRQAFEDAAKMSPEERRIRATRFLSKAKASEAPEGRGQIVVPLDPPRIAR